MYRYIIMKLTQSWSDNKDPGTVQLTAKQYNINLDRGGGECVADIDIELGTANNLKFVRKISGTFGDVFDAVIVFLSDNNVDQSEISFINEIDQAKFDFDKSIVNNKELTNTTAQEIGYNLRKLLAARELKVKDFAKNTNKNSGNIYRELKGDRPISIEQAINYSKSLNCDPVKILFKDLRTKVWGATNTMTAAETYRTVSACEIFPKSKDDQRNIIVPRDIYQENIECFEIISEQSSLHKHAVFYYKSFKKIFIYNKQVVLGLHEKDDFLGDEYRYYFGILENYRGKINLINPDPFKKGVAILEDINVNNIIFVSQVVAIINNRSLQRSITENKIISANNLISVQTKLEEVINVSKVLAIKIKRETPKNIVAIRTATNLYKKAYALNEATKIKLAKLSLLINTPITKKAYDGLFEQEQLADLEKNVVDAYARAGKLAS